MMKSILQSRPVQTILAFILAAYMVLIKYSSRWKVAHKDIILPHIESEKGVIFLVWHSRFFMMSSAVHRSWKPTYILISQSKDGDLISRTAKFSGVETIRGSTRKQIGRKGGGPKAKGSIAALRKMKKVLAAGGNIMITPDGPRGPRQRLGDGPIWLAKNCNAVILPCAISARARIQFNSWDRFILPLPFGRGRIIWGTPVTVPPDAEEKIMQELRIKIENEMNGFLKDADIEMGHIAVEAEALSS